MIKVYIRSLKEEKSELLGEFIPSEVDNIVGLAKKYGVSIYKEDTSIEEEKYWDSQFVVDPDNPHFEIIVD